MMVIHQVVGDNYREVGEIGHAQAVNLIQIADAYPPDRLCHQIFSLVGFDRLHWSNLRFAVSSLPFVILHIFKAYFKTKNKNLSASRQNH